MSDEGRSLPLPANPGGELDEHASYPAPGEHQALVVRMMDTPQVVRQHQARVQRRRVVTILHAFVDCTSERARTP